MGFLVFADKDGKERFVGLESFSALVKNVEDEKYVFTYYNEDDNVTIIKRLASLKDDDPFSGSDKCRTA